MACESQHSVSVLVKCCFYATRTIIDILLRHMAMEIEKSKSRARINSFAMEAN